MNRVAYTRFCDRCKKNIAEPTNWIRVDDSIIELNNGRAPYNMILLCKACSLDFVDFWKKGGSSDGQ